MINVYGKNAILHAHNTLALWIYSNKKYKCDANEINWSINKNNGLIKINFPMKMQTIIFSTINKNKKYSFSREKKN